ncbi:hypothetical protein [Kribbella sp. CA-294648]|uniref:hypothetical protein n=1 Tax=Kribbella sp. CA-294648 TaxID=3239948 RepID=UPI003D8D3BA2
MDTSLFETILNKAAADTRARIIGDRRLGLEPHEETLTQNLVSFISRSVHELELPVAMVEIDRRSESRLYGADIALWIRGRSGGLMGLHLQAKRQYLDDTYHGIGYVPANGVKQIDRLIGGAQASGAGAGYVFYNGLRGDQPTGSACCIADYSPTRNGITVATASDVKEAAGEEAVTPRQEVEEFCTPVACLARCVKATSGAEDDDDPAMALASWWAVREGSAPVDLLDVSAAPSYLEIPLRQLDIPFEVDALNRERPAWDADERVLGLMESPTFSQVTLIDAQGA